MKVLIWSKEYCEENFYKDEDGDYWASEQAFIDNGLVYLDSKETGKVYDYDVVLDWMIEKELPEKEYPQYYI